MSYWERAKPVQRNRALAPEAIAREAVRLLDTSGLEGFSLRALANALEVAPASLYSRITGAQDALDLALDHCLGRDAVVQRAVSGDEALEVLLSLYRHLLRHPWTIQVIATRPPRGPAYLAYSEALSELLNGVGAADPLVTAYSTTNLVIGSAMTHQAAHLDPKTSVDRSAVPAYGALHRDNALDPEDVLRRALSTLLAHS